MVIKTRFLKPHLGTFLKFLTFGLFPFWSFGTLLYMFTGPDPFHLTMYSWWPTLMLIPVGSAIGYTLGARNTQITVTDTDDTYGVKQWVKDQFLPRIYKIRSENAMETILQSKKSYNQWFGNWFGSELISIRDEGDKIIIQGPLRRIDAIDTEMRFGSLQLNKSG